MFTFFGIRLNSFSFQEFYSSLPDSLKELLKREQHTQEALTILFNEIDEKREISLSGYIRLKSEITSSLINKDKIIQAVEVHPEIEDVPFEKPVFIITLPRTGSTFLHLLMSKDKRWKAPALWEMISSIPFPEEPTTETNEKTILNFDKSLKFRRYLVGSKEIMAAHGTTMKDPEELANLLKAEGIFVLIPKMLNLPKYSKFIEKIKFDDHIKIYKSIKRSLQAIAFQQNMKNRRFLLMHHLNSNVNLKALFTVFKDAQFITIHRNVEQVISSITNLTIYDSKLFQSPLSRNVKFISDFLTEKYLKEVRKYDLRRSIEEIKNCSFQRAIDINFKDLVQNPLEILREIYKQVNMEYNDECDEIFTKYLADSHKNKTSYKHINDFLLDGERIRRECQSYSKKYKIY
ncbi:unnamed protein product [Dimorphilus gyrociliatus]|uniref:Uncharacterized protein n=1 Tax=Dimorphilus gyrociliatus TaxID=2664684 RepID=A0A7I8V7Z4_9ANNE|nr:unnamed protein product [Dimorphilus gyrociliatus]